MLSWTELVERLTSSSDMHTINGVLATANSIFKRYRCARAACMHMLEVVWCVHIIRGPHGRWHGSVVRLIISRHTVAIMRSSAEGHGRQYC